MKIENFIKNQDIFGHKVGLIFGQQENSEGEQEYKTFIGGLSSILIKITFLFVLVYYGLQMIYLKDDKNTTITTLVDFK